ncbi:MAG: DUF3795 domain-containing protein [Eubacteriales bacterium]|nr:DUF3795 domain-containing protein [Eubacteriales bacterium]
MCKSICGADCSGCNMNKTCGGCAKTNGNPFGKGCFVADYIKIGGGEKFEEFKQTLADEFNALGVSGMPEVKDLNALAGSFVNLEYTLPNGEKVKFLDDGKIYLGNQLACEFDKSKCFGIIADTGFLLVCTYDANGENPELVAYVKR